MHTKNHSKKSQSRRRNWELRRQRREEKQAAHPIRSALPFLGITGVVMAAAITAASCTLCYQVQVQGQGTVFFQDQETYQTAVTQAEDRASKILSTNYSLNQEEVSTTLAPKNQVETSLSSVTGSLLESIPELEHVYTLTVDGTRIGVASDAETITQALSLVKEQYTTDETRSLHIDSQVDIRYEYLPAGTGEQTAEEIAALLLAQSPRTFAYTTQAGDTLESVTANFGMTEERFRELNPDLILEEGTPTASAPEEYPDGDAANPQSDAQTQDPTQDQAQAQDAAAQTTQTQDGQADQAAQAESDQTASDSDLADLLGIEVRTPLEAGLEITVEQSCPLLIVTTVEEVNEDREVTPALQTEDDATMFVGQQRIIQEGEPGQASVLSRVVKRCGVPVANNDLSAVTKTEATPLIVATGTQAMPEVPEGCLYLWPVRGPITSDFGYRYIFGENNFHRGIDIAASAGTAINAAADGTVLFAGVKGTYGNLVILSHSNGFLTYYAHCSKLLVNVGDSVTQGQPIAAVGSTGRSTGPHCHFEVRYENKPIDPLCYLPGTNNAPARTQIPLDDTKKDEETTTPETPDVPETPVTPVTPEVPAEPTTPEDPTTPDEPTVPADPSAPEDPADDPNQSTGDTPADSAAPTTGDGLTANTHRTDAAADGSSEDTKEIQPAEPWTETEEMMYFPSHFLIATRL